MGTVLGLSASFWAQRRVRRQLERYAPDQVVRQVSASVRNLRGELRDAVREGRAAMREREASLRTQFRPPAFG